MGGVRIGLSEARLPLKVDVVDPEVKPQLLQEFNSRLVLIYTGKTRLARNLLQVSKFIYLYGADFYHPLLILLFFSHLPLIYITLLIMRF